MKTVLLLTVALLAGCAGAPDAPDGPEAPGTGSIQGVVVDEAITPLADATVAITGTELAATTDAEGRFRFEDLAPGPYFLRVTRIGHEDVQAGAVVEAGMDEPPVTTIQLPRIPGIAPFYQTLQFDGFYECAFAAQYITDSCDFVVRTVHDETGYGPRNLQNNVNTAYQHLAPTVWTLVQEGFFDTDEVPNFRFSIADTPIDNACDCSPVFLETISDTGYAYGRLDRDKTAFPTDDKEYAVRGFLPFQETATDVAYGFNVKFQVFTTQFHNHHPADGWNLLEQDAFPGPP